MKFILLLHLKTSTCPWQTDRALTWVPVTLPHSQLRLFSLKAVSSCVQLCTEAPSFSESRWLKFTLICIQYTSSPWMGSLCNFRVISPLTKQHSEKIWQEFTKDKLSVTNWPLQSTPYQIPVNFCTISHFLGCDVSSHERPWIIIYHSLLLEFHCSQIRARYKQNKVLRGAQSQGCLLDSSVFIEHSLITITFLESTIQWELHETKNKQALLSKEFTLMCTAQGEEVKELHSPKTVLH